MNPLFADESETEKEDRGYVLPRGKKRVDPLERNNPAVEMIRRKLDKLYWGEPKAKEALETAEDTPHRSKHQQFMYDLSTSGKSLAHIQTEWHNYYVRLPDHEKHQVWQEFYAANKHHTPNFSHFVDQHAAARHARAAGVPTAPPHDEHASAKAAAFIADHTDDLPPQPVPASRRAARSVSAIKKRVVTGMNSRTAARLKARKRVQSLLFGLSLGLLSMLIALFGFFNEVVIAPFIRPNGQANATPIILGADGVAPSKNPEIIIPKINVQLPVVYNLPSAEESVVQANLNNGVIHYPQTALPGQLGNAAYFGHSSNNIFNSGKYKFAFVLLRELVPGDIFYLTFEGKVYSYRVFDKRVVAPSDTWVLGPVQGKPATATLITCDPPGTSRDRLVVWGEQISPDPLGNTDGPIQNTPTDAAALPSEGPTAWTRFWRWITPW